MTDSTSRLCLTCNQVIPYANKNRIFCSEVCLLANRKEHYKVKRELHDKKIENKIDIPCDGCLFEDDCSDDCVSYKLWKRGNIW